MTIDTDTQRDLFYRAVQLLGGRLAAAEALGVSERTIRRILGGTQQLHDGFLRDISAALLDCAKQCRDVERQLNPLLGSNRAPDQGQGDGRYERGPNKREAD